MACSALSTHGFLATSSSCFHAFAPACSAARFCGASIASTPRICLCSSINSDNADTISSLRNIANVTQPELLVQDQLIRLQDTSAVRHSGGVTGAAQWNMVAGEKQARQHMVYRQTTIGETTIKSGRMSNASGSVTESKELAAQRRDGTERGVSCVCERVDDQVRRH